MRLKSSMRENSQERCIKTTFSIIHGGFQTWKSTLFMSAHVFLKSVFVSQNCVESKRKFLKWQYIFLLGHIYKSYLLKYYC